MADLPWDELVQFSGAGVYGRESELAVLEAALDRISAASPGPAAAEGSGPDYDVDTGAGGGATRRSEVLIIGGSAGTGKSTLVTEFRRRRCRARGAPAWDDEKWEKGAKGAKSAVHWPEQRALFAAGKFDQLAGREPYSAVADAFADVCRGAAQIEGAEDDVRASLDPESRALLGRIVPESDALFEGEGRLGDCNGGGSGTRPKKRMSLRLDCAATKAKGGLGDDFKTAEALNRLNYALRLFMRSVSGSRQSGGDSNGEESRQDENLDDNESKYRGDEGLLTPRSRPRPPVVFFLDDCHWADETSVRIVESLVADPESRNVLFILSYRDDEVDETRTPHLARLLAKMESKDNNVDCMTVTKILVGPLDIMAIGRLLSDTMSLDPFRAQSLAGVVHRKTLGNIFFAIQFLILLQERELLTYSFHTLEWEWDVEAIVACTDIADNVVDVIVGRIERLPREARALLEVASFLGGSFHVDVLAAATGAYENVLDDVTAGAGADSDSEHQGGSDEKRKYPGNGILNQSFAKEEEEREIAISFNLNSALREGLLEKVSDNEYKFAHDRIQEACYSLIPEGRERDMLHYRIGRVLWEMSSRSNSSSSLLHKGVEEPPPSSKREGKGQRQRQVQEYMPFLAADQLNRAGANCMVDDSERLAVAQLNLAVAEEAMSTGAFIFAAGYLQSGVKLLNAAAASGKKYDKWSGNYDLTLRLCSAAAEAEHCCANFDRCESMARDVLANSRSLQDSLQAYFTLVECQCSDARYDDALSTGFEALAKLGEPFPKKPRIISVAGQFFRTSRMLKGKANTDLLALPRMTDGDKIAAMRLMTTLWLVCVVSNGREYLLLLTFRMVQLSLRYGLSDFSAVGFAVYGMVTCGAISVNKGYRFGPLALELLDSNKSKGPAKQTWSPRVTLFAFCGVKHFRTPLHECPSPFVEAYNIAMSTGDTEFAMLSALHYCMFYYFSGMSLVPLEKDARAYCKQMREYKQETSLYPCLAYHQCVLNLMGLSDNTYLLTGEAMDQDELRMKVVEAKNIQAVTVVMLLRMQLAYYFGETDLFKTLLRESQSLGEAFKGAHWGLVQTYFEGLVSLSIAREKTKAASRRPYLKVGRTSLKKLKAVVKCEGCNCLHMYLLLKAERMSLVDSADVKSIREAYNAAINAAGRVGFMQDKALSNELAGKFFLTKEDESWASHYLSKAYESYLEWGAKAKADQLQRDHLGLIRINKRNHRRGSVGIKSRRIFSTEAADSHKRFSVVDSSTATVRRSSRWSSSSDSLQHSIEIDQSSPARRRSSRLSMSSSSLKSLKESELS